MDRIKKVIRVGKEIEVEQGSCTVRHRISCPFDDMYTTGITDGRLYEVLSEADTVVVEHSSDNERLKVNVGPLTFTIYQAK